MAQKKRGSTKTSPRAKRPTKQAVHLKKQHHAAKSSQPQNPMMTWLYVAIAVLVVVAGVLVYTTVTGRTGTIQPAASASQETSSTNASSAVPPVQMEAAAGDKGAKLVEAKCTGSCHKMAQFLNATGKGVPAFTEAVDKMISEKKVTLTKAERDQIIAWLGSR